MSELYLCIYYFLNVSLSVKYILNMSSLSLSVQNILNILALSVHTLCPPYVSTIYSQYISTFSFHILYIQSALYVCTIYPKDVCTLFIHWQYTQYVCTLSICTLCPKYASTLFVCTIYHKYVFTLYLCLYKIY